MGIDIHDSTLRDIQNGLLRFNKIPVGYYKDYNNIVFLKEPVDEWEKIKDENGVTILEKFSTYFLNF